jgi:phage terminase large subunit-like protein
MTTTLGELLAEKRRREQHSWERVARPEQRLPAGDWRIWLIMSGRGWGKTRTGSETVRIWARENRLVNIIAPTADSMRDICIEGPAGILAVCPPNERPEYRPSTRTLLWPNGAKSLLFSAEEPERLRGPQAAKLWFDELATFKYPEEVWQNSMLGLRIGSSPQAIITTTPRPLKLIKSLVAAKTTHITRGTTYDNRPNLAAQFFTEIVTRYENTRIGRQELEGQLLEDVPGALWTSAMIDDCRVSVLPQDLERVVVGVDPAVTSGEDSDEWGIVVAGRDRQHPPHFYVFADYSGVYTPNVACDKVLFAYATHQADRIIAEVNQGGQMIESILRSKEHGFAYRGVHASRGKMVRAEPISALYEQRRVHHLGSLAKLEDELTSYSPQTSTVSPGRLDSLVWALTELVGRDYAGGWLVQGAKQFKESRDEGPKSSAELAAAQKDQAQKDLNQTWPRATGRSTMFRSGYREKRLAEELHKRAAVVVQRFDKCPLCGNSVLAIAGDYRRCVCGWDSKQEAVKPVEGRPEPQDERRGLGGRFVMAKLGLG